MEKIEAGKYVELVYEIFVVNGEEQTSVFKFNKEHPDAFVFGRDLALIRVSRTASWAWSKARNLISPSSPNRPSA